MNKLEQIETDARQEFDLKMAAARLAEKETRRVMYKATRAKFPRLTPRQILIGVRDRESWVTEYKTYSGWNPEWSPDSSWRKCRVVDDLQSAGLRFVGYADELASLRSTGYYCDNHQHDIYRGCVVQLPARNGRAQYLAGYEEPWNESFILDMEVLPGSRKFDNTYGDHDSELIDAARAADSFADNAAESARTADCIYIAEQRAEELREEAKYLRRELCDYIKEQRIEIAALMNSADEVIADPWQFAE